MSEDRFTGELSAWIDGELPAARAAEVAAHVAACQACSARAATLRRADAALRAIPLRELAPGALAEVVRRSTAGGAERGSRLPRVRRAPAPHGRWLGWAGAALGTGAAAAAMALYLVLRPDRLDADLTAASPEDLAVAIDLDTVEDLDVIANLEVLEALVAQQEGRG
jgi:anti-sigma factor RsiW